MTKKKSGKKPIEQYDHKGKKRVNNPPVELVTPATDKETEKKSYAYDPLSGDDKGIPGYGIVAVYSRRETAHRC